MTTTGLALRRTADETCWESPTAISIAREPLLRSVAEVQVDGVMVALVPPPDVSRALMDLAQATESLDQQHITLLDLGSQEDAGGRLGRERLYRGCYEFAMRAETVPVLTGQANGWGVFHNPGEDCLVALWDLPYITAFREALLDALRLHEMPMRRENHGYIAHQTMRYERDSIRTLPAPSTTRPVAFDAIWVAWADEPWHRIPLLQG